ncbi:O-antigen ligase family protein [Enterococcus sp. DIV1368d]|uniref:O-antigen ligase family protein n=1 Tax=Enterococcus sp. DIV1368d TaxID=2774736 RepID=UPI003D301390
MIKILFLFLTFGNFLTISYSSENYNINYAEVFLLFFIVLITLKILYKKSDFRIYSFSRKYIITSFIMIIYSMLTFFWSPFGMSSILPVIVYTYIILIFIFFSNVNFYLEDYIYANRILLISLIIQLSISFYLNGAINSTNYYTIKEIASTFMGNSNYLSIYISFILVFEYVGKKKYWLIYTLIASLGLLLTMSKSAIISVIFVLLFYTLYQIWFSRKKGKLWLISSLIILFGIIYLGLIKTSIGNVFLNATISSLSDGYISGRDILIINSLQDISQNIFGMGYSIKNDPHNFILISLRSFGIFAGIISIMLYLFPVLKLLNSKGYKGSKTIQAFFFAYCVLMIHTLFEIFFYLNVSTIWWGITVFFLEKELHDEHSGNIKLQ